MRQKNTVASAGEQKIILAQFEHEWSQTNSFRKSESLKHIFNLVNARSNPELVYSLLKKVLSDFESLNLAGEEEERRVKAALKKVLFLTRQQEKGEKFYKLSNLFS